jgi:hypothetical protein
MNEMPPASPMDSLAMVFACLSDRHERVAPHFRTSRGRNNRRFKNRGRAKTGLDFS